MRVINLPVYFRALVADFLISYFGNQNVHFLYSLKIMMLITLICEGAGLEYDYIGEDPEYI